MAVFVGFFEDLGLIKGELLVTDGQLESSNARFKGCAYFCHGCQQLALDDASREDLCQQLRAGPSASSFPAPSPRSCTRSARRP